MSWLFKGIDCLQWNPLIRYTFILQTIQTYTEEQMLIQFLMGLNSSYTTVRGHILMVVPFPTLSQAYSLLIQEERQRQVKNEVQFLSDNASLSAVTGKTAASQETWKPGQRRNDFRRTQLYYDHCKRPGHTVDKCFKIHGYPSKPAGRGRGGYVPNQNRKAYNAWTENEKQDLPAEVQSPSLAGLNPEQSKQLYQFLSNLTGSSQQHKHNDQDSIRAHMAGPFSEEASGNW